MWKQEADGWMVASTKKKTHLDRNYVSSLGDAKVLRSNCPSAVRSVALVVNLGQALCSEPKARASAKRLVLGVDARVLFRTNTR